MASKIKDKLIEVVEKMLTNVNISTKNKLGLKLFRKYLWAKNNEELKYLYDDIVERDRLSRL